MRAQIACLLLACLAFELSQAWLIKLPKLEDLLEAKEHKKELKKLDFLNLFAAKEEKKENEWDKLKQWFEEKKLKELDFFESLKEKKEEKLEKLEEKLEKKLKKKTGKKLKSKPSRTTVDCYEVEATTETSYQHEEYPKEEYTKEEEYEEEEEEQVAAYKPKPCDCKPSSNYQNSVPRAYEVREDYEDGVRYFT